MSREIKSALILGGAGLVGYQVARRLASDLAPGKIIIVSLWGGEVREAVRGLRRAHPDIEFDGYFGDVFVRGDLNPVNHRMTERSPAEFKSRPANRRRIFADTFLDFETAYRESALVRLILSLRPSVVVDSMPTATAISYQDEFTASRVMMHALDRWREEGVPPPGLADDIEALLIGKAVPQLILHTRLLSRALSEATVHMYLKIGTTGTGGMGLNIPYTHGEDKPSPTLMAKTSVAFAHTGLLFLMARSPGGTIIKELKPAAMIGYRDVGISRVKGAQFVPIDRGDRIEYEKRPGRPYVIYRAETESLAGKLDTTPKVNAFIPRQGEDGKPLHLEVACVNTGENGLFTKGEFETITHDDQMEMITPEEIAEVAVLEIAGSNTGRDLLSAVDSTILGPSYKGGMVRRVALDELDRLEKEQGVPSIALGQLGPPQLSKYLYEAHLFVRTYGRISAVLAGKGGPRKPGELSERLLSYVSRRVALRDTVTSIGIPILHPDGRTIYRGPYISIPGYVKGEEEVPITAKAVDAWARKGWIDLRPVHMRWWLKTFRAMQQSARRRSLRLSSELIDRRVYLDDAIRIGPVVAWIFNNRLDPPGHRIK